MKKRRGFADNGECPIVLISGETLPITKSALPLFGKTLEGEGGCVFLLSRRGFVWYVGRGSIAFHRLPTIRRHSVTWAMARRNPKGVRGC